MNDQESSESNKLMIVESGKGKKGNVGAGTSSSPPIFQRQIVGRHVIYSGNDGSKLHSLAEARRFFKHKGHPFIESQFDFAPPALTEKKNSSSPIAAVVDVSGKKAGTNRGRPKKGGAASSTPKLATTRRRELADDLKTIRDALKTRSSKTDEDEDEEDQLSPEPPPNRRGRPGRPKRQNQSSNEFVSPSKSSASDPWSSDYAEMETSIKYEAVDDAAANLGNEHEVSPTMSKSAVESEASSNRPSRQRRPNQRYTDLISESEVVRKKVRKDSACETNTPVKESTTPAPKVFVTSATSSTMSSKFFPALKFGGGGGRTADVQRTPKLKAETMQSKISTVKTNAKQGAVKKSKPLKPKPGPQMRQIRTSSTSVMGEMLADDRDESVSPLASGEFEAPPEFVEIQQRASTPQEDQLPPVLPAAPSPLPAASTLPVFYSHTTTSSGANTVEPAYRDQRQSSTMANVPSYKRYEMTTTAAPLYDGDESPDSESEFEPELASTMRRKVIMPVKRGRKPNSGMASVTSSRRGGFGRSSLDDSSASRGAYGATSLSSFARGHRRLMSSSTRSDHDFQGIKVMGRPTTLESPPLLDVNPVGARRQSSGRGLAKLQHGDGRKITLGRYGAASAREPPPELEPFGSGVERKISKPQGDHMQRSGRQAEPTDPSVYCQLPPEVVSDHCYGRQLSAAGFDDRPKMHGRTSGGASAGTKRNGQSSYEPPPSLQRAEPRTTARQQYRRLEQRQFRTPSPPPYQSQRHHYAASSTANYSQYPNMDYGGDLGAGGSSSTMRGGQQMAMLSDKLPANILEEDDGDTAGEHITSVNI